MNCLNISSNADGRILLRCCTNAEAEAIEVSPEKMSISSLLKDFELNPKTVLITLSIGSFLRLVKSFSGFRQYWFVDWHTVLMHLFNAVLILFHSFINYAPCNLDWIFLLITRAESVRRANRFSRTFWLFCQAIFKFFLKYSSKKQGTHFLWVSCCLT